MRIVSLASGSGGNAYIVESCASTLVIDCGISYSTFLKRANEVGVNPASVCGVLFTHEHTDHTRGAVTFNRRNPNVPFFANIMTAEAMDRSLCGSARFACFEAGQPFEIGPFSIEAFSIPHDVSDPVGFLIRSCGVAYFHATDIGTPLDSIGRYLAKANMATLESNHDPQLLRMSARPQMLKQRISGPRGHLSNGDAASLVSRYASSSLEYLALAHLSSECNEPHLAHDTMLAALQDINRGDVALEILSQDYPSQGWTC